MRNLSVLFLVMIACAFLLADNWKSVLVAITPEERKAEVAEKEARVQKFLAEHNLSALLIQAKNNFAWITGGCDSEIVITDSGGCVALLIRKDGQKYLIANNIEGQRFMLEQGLGDLGYKWVRYEWPKERIDPATLSKVVKRMSLGGTVGSDLPLEGAINVGEELKKIRVPLTQAEIKKYRWLGKQCGRIIGDICRDIKPGMTEMDIAALADWYYRREGIKVTVLLIGTDERMWQYRHLPPTEKKLNKYALVNICAEKWGLIIAVSRLVHFGPLPDELKKKIKACAYVDATYIDASRPGATLGEIFQKGMQAYAEVGFPGEWKNHHQGGTIGYDGRDQFAFPHSPVKLMVGSACAWNPTIRGVKVEDTIIITENGPEIVTATPNWPMIEVTVNGRKYLRPDILVR
jgi:antitoxin VapB